MSGLRPWSETDHLKDVGNTDHWSKMKLRVLMASESFNSSGNVESDDGIKPADFLTTRPVNFSTSSPRKHLLENSFSKKAKEGFRYWDIYRPKPTKFGKYGVGSYKTFLGLGSAPRT